MKILLVHKGILPAPLYGGTERVVWYLGQALISMGHDVTFLCAPGSKIPFGKMKAYDFHSPIDQQIGGDFDILHFHQTPDQGREINKPYLVTMHGNSKPGELIDKNTVFVSYNHAQMHGCQSFVYNGLGWDDYTSPHFDTKRNYFHFLGKAAWRVKNLQGAIDVVLATKDERLQVLGGSRLNFKMGFRWTLSRRIIFQGMVGGTHKESLLNGSRGLIFPVRWHEPFGLAIIESLYYGCPVFGTPYGALPELVNQEVGFLSSSASSITEALSHVESFSKIRCHEYARDKFSALQMAHSYLVYYERILNGECLNPSAPASYTNVLTEMLPWDK